MTAKRQRHSGKHGRGHSAKCREAKRVRSNLANKRPATYTAPKLTSDRMPADEDASVSLSDGHTEAIALPPVRMPRVSGSVALNVSEHYL